MLSATQAFCFFKVQINASHQVIMASPLLSPSYGPVCCSWSLKTSLYNDNLLCDSFPFTEVSTLKHKKEYSYVHIKIPYVRMTLAPQWFSGCFEHAIAICIKRDSFARIVKVAPSTVHIMEPSKHMALVLYNTVSSHPSLQKNASNTLYLETIWR